MIVDHLRDSARTMAEPADPAAVTAMRIWHCKYRSLAGLTSFTELRTLIVASYPDASLEPLLQLSGLRYLLIVHLPQVRDLSPLGELKGLETLRLATLPSWDASRKTTEVTSLEPLSTLDRLRHVELFGIVPPDRSLRPLERCSSLATVRVSHYPTAEVARFYAASGTLDSFAPESAVVGW
jgi:hypothetical protein